MFPAGKLWGAQLHVPFTDPASSSHLTIKNPSLKCTLRVWIQLETFSGHAYHRRMDPGPLSHPASQTVPPVSSLLYLSSLASPSFCLSAREGTNLGSRVSHTVGGVGCKSPQPLYFNNESERCPGGGRRPRLCRSRIGSPRCFIPMKSVGLDNPRERGGARRGREQAGQMSPSAGPAARLA